MFDSSKYSLYFETPVECPFLRSNIGCNLTIIDRTKQELRQFFSFNEAEDLNGNFTDDSFNPPVS